ncbi:MAG: GNAT family N-acetyltransferase [Roseburia sp.]|nr:GNAT family N-acetyltransferase [Roseburia sp.]
MMKLWKETFHDSKEYVELVFDTYFSESFTPNIYMGEKLVAAMMAIPYEMSLTSGDSSKSLKALYLCGLATVPQCRCQGLMGKLIEEIDQVAREEKFDLLFLIPADEHLRNYYKKFGFEDAFPICVNKYHENLKKSKEKSKFARIEYFNSVVSLLENIKKSGMANFDDIFEFINQEESVDGYVGVVHSRKDLFAAIDECFISRGGIYLGYDEYEKIKGLIFLYDKEPVEIYFIKIRDEALREEFLERVASDFPKREILIKEHCSSSCSEISSGDFRGMMKFLKNSDSGVENCKILSGEISLMLD